MTIGGSLECAADDGVALSRLKLIAAAKTVGFITEISLVQIRRDRT
jgi:hypothetical protein